ncbi:MAG: hypothetical protein IJV92_08595 [Phascolarctobacterium sp.]|nr:hypothetical protein [Phascolarctobacterium sp.]
MSKYYYSALDIAAIISGFELGCKAETKMINRIWDGERYIISPKYANKKRKFILDVYYWMRYFYEKPILDKEFPIIQKDFEAMGSSFDLQQYTSDFTDLDLFFKNIRIRILYADGNDYVRIKLRSLLKHYGYKRRSKAIMRHIKTCMRVYKLIATQRGKIPCVLEDIDLDTMLSFRIKS